MNTKAEIDEAIDESAAKLHGLGLLNEPIQEGGYTAKGEEIVRTLLHEIEAAGLTRKMQGDAADDLNVLRLWLTDEGFDKESVLSIFDWTVLIAPALPPFLRIKQRLDFNDRVGRRH